MEKGKEIDTETEGIITGDGESRKRDLENNGNVCKQGYGKEATESERVDGGKRKGNLDNNRWGL